MVKDIHLNMINNCMSKGIQSKKCYKESSIQKSAELEL
jgi:hypothetical protein